MIEKEDQRMEKNKAEAALEAILFAVGDSVSTETLAAAIGQDSKSTEQLLLDLAERYQNEERGIRLTKLDDSWQMCSAQEYYEYLIRIVSQPRKISLTDVLMETLAIIAYKQPVTKLEIETIRGVKSDHAVNRLIEYNLVRELGRLNAPGRPILFGTTEEFLRHFGLHSLEDLPVIDTLQMEDFKAEAEEEAGKETDGK